MSLKDCPIGPAAAVSDMERAAEFYEQKLGFESSDSGDEMRNYPLGGDTALTVYVSEFAGTNKATLAGFAVDDFDAVHSELTERGVKFEVYDEETSGVKTDESGVMDAGGMKVAFFKDPDGNTFSINGS